MIRKIDHIGIAVKNLQESLENWIDLFGFELLGKETVEEEGIELAFLRKEDVPPIELMAALDEDSPVKKFLEKRGEGIHHICFEVEHIGTTLETMKNKGVRLIHEEAKKGAGGSQIAFIHPKSLNGVLVELKEKKKK